MNALRDIKGFGQRIWLDNLSHTLLKEGTLQQMIDEDGLAGVTSNPSIFLKAIKESPYYQAELAHLKADPNLTAEQRYERLAIADIQAACDLFIPLFEASGGDDGYVSLEVSPFLAHDEPSTIAAAHRLRDAVNRPNVLIKVPATPAGVSAIERLVGDGVNINVTLIFSVQQYQAVAQAYLAGARRLVATGGDAARLKSVASIFLSRVDTLVDRQLEAIGTASALALRGTAAITLAQLAYAVYQRLFHGTAYADLSAAKVRPQWPLWASTGTKNPAYSDVVYIQQLIGAETVNTAPDSTLAAFRDHGQAADMLGAGPAEAEQNAARLAAIGIDLEAVGETLRDDGVRLFEDSYRQLLEWTT